MVIIVEIKESKLPRPFTDRDGFLIYVKESIDEIRSALSSKFGTNRFVFLTKTGEILKEGEVLDVLASDSFIYVYKTAKGPSLQPCALLIRIPGTFLE